MTTRKQRGSETQTIVARYLTQHGWPHALPVGAGRIGADITGVPGLAIEVKARRGLNLPTWLRQASANGDHGLPILVHRPDGYGEARIGDWPATMRLADLAELLREAGYGSLA